MLGGAWPCDSISISRSSNTVVMPRPCSPLRSAAKPAHRSSLLGYAIAPRIFTLPSLCMANLRRSIPSLFCANPSLLRSLHFPGYVLPCYSLADPILSGPSFAIAIFSMPINSLAGLGKAMPWLCFSFRRIAFPFLGYALPRLSLLILANPLQHRSGHFHVLPLLCYFCSLAGCGSVFPDIHGTNLALLLFLLYMLPCKCSLARVAPLAEAV